MIKNTFDGVYDDLFKAITDIGYKPFELTGELENQPSVIKDSSFALSLIDIPTELSGGRSTGSKENKTLNFNIILLYNYPPRSKHSENESRALGLIDDFCKSLYNYSISAGYTLNVLNITAGKAENGFKPFEVICSVLLHYWSMKS